MKQAVVAALEAMAALGHARLLQSTAVPVLYATAHLDRTDSATTSRPPDLASSLAGKGQGNAMNSQQTVSSCTQKDQWGRDVALQALARMACASSSLRQPILARLIETLPMALTGADSALRLVENQYPK